METARPLIDRRRHELTVSLPPQPIWLHADAARLEQVVVNLLTNAAKYTDEGGHIWLSVEQEGDEAVLRVRDTGVGIAPELLPRIFDLFTQAERSLDRSQGGLGIGLALVQRLVEMHRGTGGGAQLRWGRAASSSCACRWCSSPAPQAAGASRRNGRAGRTRACGCWWWTTTWTRPRAWRMLLRISGHEVRTAHDGPGGTGSGPRLPPGRGAAGHRLAGDGRL